MTEANAAGTAKGPGIVLQPEEGESYWQPVWANGYSTVKISPKNGTLNLAMGVQVIAPGGYVREHSHTPNQEILFCFEGKGTVLVAGCRTPSFRERRFMPAPASAIRSSTTGRVSSK